MPKRRAMISGRGQRPLRIAYTGRLVANPGRQINSPTRGPARRNPRAAVLERDLRASTTDGALYCVMVGVGESYLALFVLAAGLGEVASGLVLTVPLLLGSVIQLASPWGVRVAGSYRKWIVLAASVQAASFIPLAAMAIAGWIPLWLVFLVATVYWAASMSCGAAWTTWIGILVPSRIRAHYFARRSRLCHIATLLGLVGGGLVLQYGASDSQNLVWFAAIFLVAGVSRGGSAFFLSRQTETGPVPDHHRQVGPVELLGRFRHGRDGRFMLYLMFMQVGVQMAQPYFAPFMRAQLELDYFQILSLTGAAFIAKAFTQPLWGVFARRVGTLRLLWIGGLGIVPLSGLWLVSDSFTYLLITQLLAGTLWAAYELATLLMMFETIREEERTSLWSTFNLGNSAAMVAGSLLGGAILKYYPEAITGYKTIFMLSVVARLATVFYLLRTRDVLRTPEVLVVGESAVRASAGSIGSPILASLPRQVDESAVEAGEVGGRAAPGLR